LAPHTDAQSLYRGSLQMSAARPAFLAVATGHAYTDGWPRPVYCFLKMSCTSARGEPVSIIRKCLFPRMDVGLSEVTPPMVSVASELAYVPLHSLTNRLLAIDRLAHSLYVTHSICFFAGRVVQTSEAALRLLPLRQCHT
jgi:hypothetical protein